jgi:hypothetical protein
VYPQWRKFDEDCGTPVPAKTGARLPLPDVQFDGPPTATDLPPSPAAAHAYALAHGGAPGDGAPSGFLGWLGSVGRALRPPSPRQYALSSEGPRRARPVTLDAQAADATGRGAVVGASRDAPTAVTQPGVAPGQGAEGGGAGAGASAPRAERPSRQSRLSESLMARRREDEPKDTGTQGGGEDEERFENRGDGASFRLDFSVFCDALGASAGVEMVRADTDPDPSPGPNP